MALATQADVEARLQIAFDNDPEPVVTGLLADAQAHIEAYVGRALESADHEERYDPVSRAILLRHWPVTAVTTVAVDGTPLVVANEIVFYDWGRVYRVDVDGVADGHPRTWGSWLPLGVEVAYTGGYLAGTHDRELAHLGSICAEVVARAFRMAADWVASPAGNIASVDLAGSDTVSYTDLQGLPAETVGRFLALLDSERVELDVYR